MKVEKSRKQKAGRREREQGTVSSVGIGRKSKEPQDLRTSNLKPQTSNFQLIQ
jgi:hypothetical protein